MFDASEYWITVVELPSYLKAVEGLLTNREAEGLVQFLAKTPDAGVIIPGSGGLRKVRWAARGRGKRSGARIIYYFRDLNMPVYLLTAFGKGEKLTLTKDELAQMRRLVEQLVAQQWTRWVGPRVDRALWPIG